MTNQKREIKRESERKKTILNKSGDIQINNYSVLIIGMIFAIVLLAFVRGDISFQGQTPAASSITNSLEVNLTNMTTASGDFYSFLNLDNSLIGWWRFNNETGENDTFVKDYSIYSNNGTMINGTFYNSSGKFGMAAGLDGVNDYISMRNASSLFITSNLTVSFWAKVSSLKDPQFPVAFGSTGYSGWAFIAGSPFNFRLSNGTTIAQAQASYTLPIETWYHIVGIYNGTTTQLYLNGSLAATSTAVTGSIDYSSLPNGFLVGNAQGLNTARYFNGSVDDLLVFNRTLSSSEILSLYNSTANKYYVNFTSTSTQGSHTLTGYSADSSGGTNSTETRTITFDTVAPVINYVGATPSNNTYTTSTEVIINATINEISLKSLNFSWNGINYTTPRYDLTANGINSSSLTNYNNSSLILALRFDNVSSIGDNTTRVVDLSASSNNGTITGAVYNSSGKFGRGLTFNGSGSYVVLPDGADLKPTSITISMWFKPNQIYAQKLICMHWNDVCIQLDTVNVTYNMYNIFSARSRGAVTAGAWQQVAITFDNSTKTSMMYLNGVIVDNATWSSQITWESGSHPPVIGALADSYATNFNGTIDEVNIYNRALSNSEIQQQYQNSLSGYNLTQWRFYTNQSSLSNGVYNYNLNVIDGAGYTNTSYGLVTLDTANPNATLISPSNATNTNIASQNFTVNITDNSGIKNATLNIYNSSGLVNQTTTNITSGTVSAVIGTVVSVVDGVYNWWYKIFDWAGNTFTTSNNTITFDLTAPLINITYPSSNGLWFNYQINISGNESDLNIGTCRWTKDGGTTNNTLTCNSNINGQTWSEGSNTVIIYSNDTFGNTNLSTRQFNIDTILPVPQFIGPTQNSGVNLSQNWIYVNISLTEINYANITFNLYNSTGLVNSTFSSSTLREINWTNLPNVIYSYNVTVFDLAGNQNSTETRIITLDTTNPNATLLTPTNNTYTSNATQNFTINLTDNLSGLQNATLNLYNSTGLVNQTTTNFASGVVNTVIGTVVSVVDGVYNWWYNLVDRAGNIFNTGNNTLTVDTTLPQIQFVSPTIANDSGIAGNFTINVTIYDINFANVSYYWNGTTINFNSTNESITNLGSGNWIFTYIQSVPAGSGQYLYNVSTSDLAGNTNATETRLVNGNIPPSLSSISTSPNSTDYDNLDPGANVTITANITDTTDNFEGAILQWKNSTSDWDNITMNNITTISRNTILNVTLPLPNYESNITFRIWANDTVGGTSASDNYTLQSFWDCTWQSTSDLGATAGWDINKGIGDILINNTGDSQYATSNCSLDFRLTYNLPEERIYFDNDYVKPSNTYTIAAKSTRTISLNATFLTLIQQENAIISTSEFRGRSNSAQRNTTSTIVTNQNGPYLYEKITSSPGSVSLTTGEFSLAGYLRNLMGSIDINDNYTAYNVSFYWVIPSGLTNSSGSLNISYENITDNSLNYLNTNITFSSLADMTPGVKTIYLYAQGYNKTGGLVKDANGNSLLSSSVNVTFSCYNVSDGVVVSACGSLDGDYVAPTTTATTSGSSSGGGGASGAGGGISQKSEATFELVHGKDNSFSFDIINKYIWPMQNVKISVSGDKSSYVDFNPKAFAYLDGKGSKTITVKINAPSYFTQGKYKLFFDITGQLNQNGSITEIQERKVATLAVLEMSKEDALNSILEIQKWTEEMNNSGMIITEMNKLFISANNSYISYDYLSLKTQFDNAKKIYSSAIESKAIIAELETGIKDAETRGITVIESKKLLYLAETAFNRGDYILANDRLKEAKLTYALEVKGEFSIIYEIKNNPVQTGGIALGVLLIGTGSTFLIRGRLLRRKIRMLEDEEKLLLELMKVVQKECFEKMHMSMEEYDEAMKQYEIKLSETIEDKIKAESQLSNLLKVKGKRSALAEEKAKIISLIRVTQDDYMNKGKLETRIYDNMLKSYSTRLSEIEEQLSFFEVQDALKNKVFFSGGKK